MLQLKYDIELDSMGSDPCVTDLLAMLANMIRPKVVVECGTYLGRTATLMANSMIAIGHRDFHIFTAETDEGYANGAQTLAENNGMGPQVTVYMGDAIDMLAEIVPDTIDLSYIDGGNRLALTRTIYDRTSDGGLIVLDDANQYKFTGYPEPVMVLRAGRGLAIFQKYRNVSGNGIDFHNTRSYSYDYRAKFERYKYDLQYTGDL